MNVLGSKPGGDFDCGQPKLNEYLLKRANQDQRRRVAACYVLVEQAADKVAGYYTLSAGSVQLAELPDTSVKKLPRYPTVPLVRMGRLAVDQTFRGQGLGGMMLSDAIHRIAKSDIAAFAILVDAKDEQAVAFYERHGFTRFESNSSTLFLPISDGLKRLG